MLRAIAVFRCLSQAAVWPSSYNEAVRRTGLVLKWVTVRGYTVLIFNHNQATRTNSAWSWVDEISSLLAIVTATSREENGEFCI